MNSKLQTGCRALAFYCGMAPGQPPMETRTLVLAAYAENELPPERATPVQVHLQNCPACKSFVADLETDSDTEVAFAVCPSSKMLDAYVFRQDSLPAGCSERVEAHLGQCTLCREECDWLKELESHTVETIPPRVLPAFLAAAAVLIVVISVALFRQGNPSAPNANQLRALGVIKPASEINYAELQKTSAPLTPASQNLYEQGVEHFKVGHFQHAVAYFEKVVQESPGHAGATFLLGYCYYELNQPQKAFELCDRAESIRPHSLERCMFLVHLALKTGYFNRALEEISGLHHAVPDNPEVDRMYRSITALMTRKT